MWLKQWLLVQIKYRLCIYVVRNASGIIWSIFQISWYFKAKGSYSWWSSFLILSTCVPWTCVGSLRIMKLTTGFLPRFILLFLHYNHSQFLLRECLKTDDFTRRENFWPNMTIFSWTGLAATFLLWCHISWKDTSFSRNGARCLFCSFKPLA